MSKSSSKQIEVQRRRALVTGASTGIGRAFAEQLAAIGYDVVLVARSRDRLDQLAHDLAAAHGIVAQALPADLTDPLELRLVEGVIVDGDLDLLVNNAGFGTVGAFAEADLEEEERQLRLNVLALMRLSHAALPGMKARQRGAIVNVSSLMAFQAAPFNATYAATKAFVSSFSEALHEEVRDSGVTVQVVCPGLTRTEFQERAHMDVSSLPDMLWMAPETVVEASLAALRRGDAVCIPGLSNRAMASLSSSLPRSWTRRLVAFAAKRFIP